MAELDKETQESWNYLQEVVGDYERYISDIGNLGLAAPNLLYYRDEVQELLEEFKADRRVDFAGTWARVKALDEIVRKRAGEIVREVGHRNFNQYRIINDPPKSWWWWYLDRVVPAPPAPAPWWQFWRPERPGDGEPTAPADAPPPAEPPPT